MTRFLVSTSLNLINQRNPIMEITLSDLRDLIAPAPVTATLDTFGPADQLDPQPGDKLIIRTVTMTLTGQVVACSPTWIILDSAAWIADSGRWADAIASGTLNEVEPMGDGVRVARAAVIDVTPWVHGLQTVQK